MLPDCQHGFMKHTNITESLSVGHLPPQIKSEVCLGVKIPCSHYEPHFMPGETLLLGAHREGFNNEKCVVSKDGNLYICTKKIKIENGIRKINYFSIYFYNVRGLLLSALQTSDMYSLYTILLAKSHFRASLR